MEGERDSFPFVLALDLGRTLTEMDAMPYPEYMDWQAFYTYRAAMREMEAQ
jgi:hypothetical protein